MKFSKHVLFTRSIYVKYLGKTRCVLFSLLVLRGLASKHFHVCRASGTDEYTFHSDCQD